MQLKTKIKMKLKKKKKKNAPLRNPGRDISFPIFTRKEIETKRIRKEIKTIISRLNHFLSFLSNKVEKKLKREYLKENQKKKKKKKISFFRLNISFIQHNAGLQLVVFFHQWEARNILIYRDIMLINRDLKVEKNDLISFLSILLNIGKER